MTSLTRWRIACAAFAALAGAAALHGRAEPMAAPSAQVGRAALFRPIRVPAAALGVSPQELVDQILAARTADEMSPFADKLAAIGGNDTVDAIAPLLEDPRKGVPTVAAGVIGHIATDHAIDILLQRALDERLEV